MCKPMDTQNQEVALPTTSSMKLNLQFGNLFPALITDTHPSTQRNEFYTNTNSFQHKDECPDTFTDSISFFVSYMLIYSIYNILMQKTSNAPLCPPVNLLCNSNSVQF